MEPVTLVAPDGREYVTTSVRELNDLTMGQGYSTLSSKNDKAEKKAATPKSEPKNEAKNEESNKDDAPVPAKQDTGHTPSTDSK